MHSLIQRGLLKLAAVVSILVVVGALQGCAISHLTGIWSDPEYAGGPIESVVVVGLSDKVATRRLFEHDFSQALKKLGVSAVVSETILPAMKPVSKEEATEIIRNSGSKAAIVTRTVSIDTKTEIIPGRVDYIPGGSFRSTFPGQYGYTTMYTPPQQYQYKVIRVETSLYDLTTEKCLWSATSEAVDPKEVDTLITSIIKTVIKDLQAKHLLPAGR